MSTTTVRLTDAMKARIRQAAESQGVSAHAFILEAIAEKTQRCEQQQAFHDSAAQRLARLAQSGETIAWTDMRDYLSAHVRGEPVDAPASHPFGD